MKVEKLIRFLKKFNYTMGILMTLFLIIGVVLLWADPGYCSAAEGVSKAVDTKVMAWAFIAAAAATGLSTIAAGVAVSMVGSSALGAIAERPELMGKSIIYVGLAEGIGIYGLIVSIMILFKI